MRASLLIPFMAIALFPYGLSGQSDSSQTKKTSFQWAGYADIFFALDASRPDSKYRQPFLYNHNRHDRPGLNQGIVKLAVRNPVFRANLALQAGTYPNDNYAHEPGILKNIFEANAGFSLNKKQNCWVDAGIFASHIGFESAISLDNWTLTRSLAAENSPYYLSGVQLSYAPSPKWEMALLAVNGWQHISTKKFPDASPALGTRLTYKPSGDLLLNWSTFIGSEHTRRMRYFNNFYGQFQLNKKTGIIAGLDIGTEKKSGNGYAVWLTPQIIARHTFSEKWKTAFRAEYYSDRNGVIIPTATPHGFQTGGISLNFDYSPLPLVACRIEGRWLHSRDRIFTPNQKPANNNFFLVASVAARWESK